jgi:hypothetical protein
MSYTIRSLEQHLDRDIRPKRILTLDGGGVRGMLTLSFTSDTAFLIRVRA